MKKSLLKLLIAFAFSVFVSASHAQLLTMDWLSSGDGLLTYDTITGLYWLDTSFTAGGDATTAAKFTYGKIEARTKNASDVLYGFRHATLAEVNVLFNNAGLLLMGNGYQRGDNATPAQTQAFITQFGATLQSGVLPWAGSRADVFGFTSALCSEVVGPGCPVTKGNENFHVYAGAGVDWLLRTHAELVGGYQLTDNYKVNVGHFLVINYFPNKR